MPDYLTPLHAKCKVRSGALCEARIIEETSSKYTVMFIGISPVRGCYLASAREPYTRRVFKTISAAANAAKSIGLTRVTIYFSPEK